MVGTHIHHYRIIRQLGAGGMGVVYEAVDTRLGRHVALKLLSGSIEPDDDAVSRFEREARIASSLNHPNICTIHDIGVYEEPPGADTVRMGGASIRHHRFIVMELLEGESLREKIRGEPLPLDLILDVGSQMADALDAAHARGIIHRDVKPANIVLTRRGPAKLLDFGVAKLGGDVHEAVAETRAAGDLTSPGMAIGSINYMSPEQARGEPLDGRTDLFSLGLVLYEMATGRQAFAGRTTAVVFDAILNRQPAGPRLSNPLLPEELEQVIHRLIEKDPGRRFQTAAELLAELTRIRRDAGIRTAVGQTGFPTATKAPQAPVRNRKGLAVAVVAAGALSAAAAAGWHFLRPPGPPVLTEKDTLLVADFTNTTGDPVFDDALKQAVAVQLQQTPFVTLVPDRRVQRTLALMKRGPDEPLREAVAREVCQRAGAKATVEGSIAALGSSYVIGLAVHNCESGASLARQQLQAASKEDVLKVVGVAVTEIRKTLGESLASIEKYDVPVIEATTGSLEALRFYGMGNRTRTTKGDEAAIPFFQKAIEVDPSFALAYAKLGVVQANRGMASEARANAAKAYGLKDRVSEYERLYIEWNHATRVRKDQNLALQTLEMMAAAYPRDFSVRNNLGVQYQGRREYAKAAEQYARASELAPDEPLPMANAAQTLLLLDRRDEAFQWAEKSFATRADGGLAMACWLAAARAGDARAEIWEQRAAASMPPQQLLLVRAGLALWQGRLRRFLALQNDARNGARANGDLPTLAQLELGELMTRANVQDGSALESLRLWARQPGHTPPLRAQAITTLAMLGDDTTARALLPSLENNAGTSSSVRVPVIVARAFVSAADGKASDAVRSVEPLAGEYPDVNYSLGRLREAAGDRAGAIDAYRAHIALPIAAGNFVVALCRLRLAELLLAAGDQQGASQQLDILLAQWRDADADFPPLLQARELKRRASSS